MNTEVEKTPAPKRYPYFAFFKDDCKVHLEGRFWNCQGNHLAIVASVTKNVDWAAYIGCDAPHCYTEETTLTWVAAHGCKLPEKDARHFFPEIKLLYRC